jgi:hypothetical protein
MRGGRIEVSILHGNAIDASQKKNRVEGMYGSLWVQNEREGARQMFGDGDENHGYTCERTPKERSKKRKQAAWPTDAEHIGAAAPLTLTHARRGSANGKSFTK